MQRHVKVSPHHVHVYLKYFFSPFKTHHPTQLPAQTLASRNKEKEEEEENPKRLPQIPKSTPMPPSNKNIYPKSINVTY